MTNEEQLRKYMERDKRRNEITAKLVSEGMPMITAIVVGGDLASAEAADRFVKNGMPVEKALTTVGSYARFDWAIKNLPKDRLLARLPELWRSADPNDTDRQYLELWREAFQANGNVIITDGQALPLTKNLKIYRGQVGDEYGISWTLDRSIAEKFAATGGGRQPVVGGRVLEIFVTRGQILAYLTGRSESEVIVDLDKLSWTVKPHFRKVGSKDVMIQEHVVGPIN